MRRAFARRWANLTPEQLRAEAIRDPLLFVVDHVSILDGHEGAVVVLADLGRDLPPTIFVVPNAPPGPSGEDCLGQIAGIVSSIDSAMDRGVGQGELSAVRRLGVVTHRLGAAMVGNIDWRWMSALGLVSVALRR
ncbi:MAG: hypothetical protein ACO3JT_08750 [Candidatus Nanopelagicales bacterium]